MDDIPEAATISVWAYDPSFPLAVVTTVVYALIFIAIAYQTFMRHRTWYFAVVVVGAAMEVPGYAFRCYSIKNQSDIAIYAASLTLVVLAPVLVAAGNYILLGHLVRELSHLDTTGRTQRPLMCGLRGQLISRAFIVCDIIAFLVQCSGSAIATVNNWFGPSAQVGVWVLVGGLVFQLVAVLTFLCVLGQFHRRSGAAGFVRGGTKTGWEKVLMAVWISSLMIVIRCIYRVVEFAEGIDGYTFTHEWVFYVFETVPVIFAIGVFCVWHPGAYLSHSENLRRASRGNDSDTRDFIPLEDRNAEA